MFVSLYVDILQVCQEWIKETMIDKVKHKISFRFAYVCYATGLLKEGLFLLHLLTILLILAMCVLTALMQPLK